MSSKIVRFSNLAERIHNQHLRLVNEGVTDPHQIFNQMMPFLPELHELWTKTTDNELAALSTKYPSFMKFCLIVEELSAIEAAKETRDYDGQQKFSEQQIASMEEILVAAAHIQEELLKSKQQSDKVDFLTVQNYKNSLETWMSKATLFKDQLSKDEASEYSMKTVDAVITENYNRTKSLLDTLRKVD
jgi:hypothetical protein